MNGGRHFGIPRSERHAALDASYPADKPTWQRPSNRRAPLFAKTRTASIAVGLALAIGVVTVGLALMGVLR